MSQSRVDLVFHPIRFRMLVLLENAPLTAYEVAEKLPDVPQSSIYRHLKLLLDGELIVVHDTREVNGITQKVYYAPEPSYPGIKDDLGQLSLKEQLKIVQLFGDKFVTDFGAYFKHAYDEADEDVNANTDHAALLKEVTFQDMQFYATPEEFEALTQAFKQLIHTVRHNTPQEGRKPYKFVIALHPMAPDQTPPDATDADEQN